MKLNEKLKEFSLTLLKWMSVWIGTATLIIGFCQGIAGGGSNGIFSLVLGSIFVGIGCALFEIQDV